LARTPLWNSAAPPEPTHSAIAILWSGTEKTEEQNSSTVHHSADKNPGREKPGSRFQFHDFTDVHALRKTKRADETGSPKSLAIAPKATSMVYHLSMHGIIQTPKIRWTMYACASYEKDFNFSFRRGSSSTSSDLFGSGLVLFMTLHVE